MGGLSRTIWLGPKHHHECPYVRIRGRLHTNTAKTIDRGRGWKEAVPSKGASRNAGSWQRQKREGPSKETQSCRRLGVGLAASRTVR